MLKNSKPSEARQGGARQRGDEGSALAVGGRICRASKNPFCSGAEASG